MAGHLVMHVQDIPLLALGSVLEVSAVAHYLEIFPQGYTACESQSKLQAQASVKHFFFILPLHASPLLSPCADVD